MIYIHYSRSLERVYVALYTICKKFTKDNPALKPEEIYFDSLYCTKGKLLSKSRFPRARGSTSPKYKNSCNLYIKLKHESKTV